MTIKYYPMNWRDVLAIMLGLKKPALVPIPKDTEEKKNHHPGNKTR